jgi:hypothetical protein
MGNGYEPITEADELAAVRAQARRVVMQSIAATVVVLALLVITF